MIEVNLNPGARRRRRRMRLSLASLRWLGLGPAGRDPWVAAAVAVAAVVVLAAGALWLTQRSRTGRLEARLEAAAADSARVSDLRALSDSLTRQRSEIDARLALVRRLDEGRYVWPHVMDEVSRALPRNAWLTSLKQAVPPPDMVIEIQGVAAAPLIITSFMRDLESSPFFSVVQLRSTSLQEVDGLAAQGFTLEVQQAQSPPEVSEGDSTGGEPILGAGT